MTASRLREIYEEVHRNLKKHCQNILTLKKGRLYNIISEILGESDCPQEKTKEICNLVGIQAYNSSSEDDEFIRKLTRIFKVQYNKAPSNQNSENDMESLLVFTACILVGVLACRQYIERKKENSARQIPQQVSPAHQNECYSAELCLVVPASEVSGLKSLQLLDGRRLKELVDLASYFLCTTKEKALAIEEGLPLTDEDIPPDSPRGVYVRVAIKSDNNIIDKTTQFEIKENIGDSKKYSINKVNWLRGLSGLESFIR